MSDTYISLVPEDPYFIPDPASVSAVLGLFKSIAPKASQIAALQADQPQFMDAGENFLAVVCTECGTDVDVDWWAQMMEIDCGDHGFKLDSYKMPCCDNNICLNDLAYHWPQAFGVFAVEAENPGIKELSDSFVETAEAALGTPLTVVYKRL